MANTFPTISTKVSGVVGRSSGSNASPITAFRPAAVSTGQKSKREASNGYTPATTGRRFANDDWAAWISALLSDSIRPRFSIIFSAASDIRITTVGTRNSASRVLAVLAAIDVE